MSNVVPDPEETHADKRPECLGVRAIADGARGQCLACGEADARERRPGSEGTEKEAEADINLQGLTPLIR